MTPRNRGVVDALVERLPSVLSLTNSKRSNSADSSPKEPGLRPTSMSNAMLEPMPLRLGDRSQSAPALKSPRSLEPTSTPAVNLLLKTKPSNFVFLTDGASARDNTGVILKRQGSWRFIKCVGGDLFQTKLANETLLALINQLPEADSAALHVPTFRVSNVETPHVDSLLRRSGKLKTKHPKCSQALTNIAAHFQKFPVSGLFEADAPSGAIAPTKLPFKDKLALLGNGPFLRHMGMVAYLDALAGVGDRFLQYTNINNMLIRPNEENGWDIFLIDNTQTQPGADALKLWRQKCGDLNKLARSLFEILLTADNGRVMLDPGSGEVVVRGYAANGEGLFEEHSTHARDLAAFLPILENADASIAAILEGLETARRAVVQGHGHEGGPVVTKLNRCVNGLNGLQKATAQALERRSSQLTLPFSQQHAPRAQQRTARGVELLNTGVVDFSQYLVSLNAALFSIAQELHSA